MFDAKSRYADSRLETLTTTLADGRRVSYKKPRIVPALAPEELATEEIAEPGERLDRFAARVMGDPELAWRLLDANEVMDPLRLDASRTQVWRLPQGRG